jgi:hypothetical protein
MAQKTNLNVSPYFDDFDPSKDYYKVLFAPGRPVQARELNNLQSQIQNQIERFGSHIFKDGSMVIPGGVTYDLKYYAVKLNPIQFGINVNIYINNFLGKKIIGRTSRISAIIDYIALPNEDENVEYITLYVKYIDSGLDNTISQFPDSESFYAEEDIVYGNTTIPSGTTFATSISQNSTAIGSAAHVNTGVYFIRGYFVEVQKQTIILDYYENNPSYKIGFTVNESIITPKEDNSLYDNAKGFTNYAAPGADRFSITLKLDKRPLEDLSDSDFVELIRTDNGEIKKEDTTTQYSIIRDYLAKRTYDESGDYSVNPFQIKVQESLNDRVGNNGVYFNGETTDEGNTPSSSLGTLVISPGIAYVGGYDVNKTTTTLVDFEKPRTTETRNNVFVLFKMGNYLRVNNVDGSPLLKSEVGLYNRRKNSTSSGTGIKIGDARLYNLSLTDSKYSGASTSWDLYLYDIQTYTEIILNESVSSTQVPQTAYIKGKSSSASGYSVSSGNNTSTLYLRETSGTFVEGEKILINGDETISRTIKNVKVFSISDIRSIFRAASDGVGNFSADTVLEPSLIPGFSSLDEFFLAPSGTLTSPGRFFSGISTDSIVSYIGNGSDVHYNRISSVSNDGTSLTLSSVNTVVGVATGTIGVSTTTKLRVSLRTPFIQSYNDGSLYTELPSSFVSSVNLQNSTLTFKAQTTTNVSVSSNTLTLDSSFFDLPIGLTTSSFQGFDQERYSIHWTDGTVESLSSDQVVLSGDLNQITFNKIQNKTVDSIIATLSKSGVKSKTKVYNKSQILNIEYSKYPKSGTNSESSIFDGLTYKNVYGIRVQDEQISLNYPDVVKIVGIFESLDGNYAELDSLTFNSLVNVFQNSIVGEKIVGRSSGAVAQVVRKPAGNPNKLDIVLLNNNNFSQGETVDFEESQISATIVSSTVGKYKNITNAFVLDGAQKTQYYDYSRLIRKPGQPEPKRKLTIIFNHYIVPSNDNGDLFTVLSYSKEQYRSLIPRVGQNQISASDILDFRPRVSPITDISSLTTSPFDFSSRDFGSSPNIEPNVILAPNETLSLSFDYYVGRVDRLYLDRTGKFTLKQGVPSIDPKPPENLDKSMLLATLYYAPYLENASSTIVSLESNKRYTMRDIGGLETRLDNLERLTTLSLLELNTKTLEIRDADGLDRFKTGFFVDNFSSSQFVDRFLSNVLIDTENKNLIPFRVENTLPNVPVIRDTGLVDNLSKKPIYKSFDGNIRFSGELGDPTSLTLDYVSVGWIEQPFATAVENVNPFHVTEYIGNLTLNPSEDSWVRTIQLPDRTFISTSVVRLEPSVTNTQTTIQGPNTTQLVRAADFDARFGGRSPNGTTRTITTLSPPTTTVVSDSVVTLGSVDRVVYEDQSRVLRVYDETYIRSRNVEFYAVNLKPFTEFYQFFDGNSKVSYISKIIEVTPVQGTFRVNEDVIGYSSNKQVIKFRLAAPNHKEGDKLDRPTAIYEGCPYDREVLLPSQYSSSSRYLNIDTKSLAKEAQGEYFGFLSSNNIRFVGQTSGAVATLRRNLLISDSHGDLIGTFYLEDPNTTPPPSVRFEVGTKTYKLTSSSTNQIPLPGSTDISYAETAYTANGTVNERRNETLINRTVTQQRQIITETTRTQTTTTLQRYDPLAQSFEVGRTSQAPTNSNVDPLADRQGAFLTAVDIFFRSVDSGNAPVTIQVRSMELGTPTLTQIGESVTLRPNDILPNGRRFRNNVSEDASVATTVVFPYPIYLAPDNEYAIVLLAPESVGYEVFIAEMNQDTLNASSLTGIAQEQDRKKYSKQFAIGSLFKSQNGSIWTADQYQDMKFKLYKARFVSNGTVFFNNPVLNSNTTSSYFGTLVDNPIDVYPRKLAVGFNTTSTSDPVFSNLTSGRKITESGSNLGHIFGFVENIGGPVASSPAITDGGENYETGNNLTTFNITGNGSGLVVNITGVNDGQITSLTVANSGSGYKVGDVVGIVTSSTSSLSGFGSKLTINSIANYDTLYLTNVQAEQFTVGQELRYYDSGIQTTDLIISSSTVPDQIYSGNIAKVNQFNHGMYSTANKVGISGLESDFAPQVLTSDLSINGSQINVDNVGIFTSFEGIPVSASNPGYVKILDEIIQYTSANTNSNILTGITRSIDSTVKSPYLTGDLVYKYELGGVSLRRLNTNLEVADISESIDSYYIEFNRGSVRSGITTRTEDTVIGGIPAPLLSFKTEDSVGGNSCKVSQNLVYSEITPLFELYSPGAAVSANSFVRTVSGTSAGGNETPFLDLGFEPVQLNVVNKLNSLRMVCSRVNEVDYLSELPNSKSYTIGLTMNSTDPNLSPQLFLDNCITNFTSYRLDKTVNDYITDGRPNEIYDSSHAATYVSNVITLEKPSTSLKVIFSAYRHTSSDFRVLYSLILADSYEVQPSFTLFPGYDNLTIDNDQDGFLDVVDESLNSGLPDRNIRPSDDNQFFEYEYTAPDLPEFVGYVIKIVMSGTDQSRPPIIKELRTIALA